MRTEPSTPFSSGMEYENFIYYFSVDGAYHYCPNCGAKMDLEEEHG